MNHRRGARGRIRIRIAAVLATVCLSAVGSVAGALSAPAAAPTCPGQGGGNTDLSGLVKQAHPVVLVHGWDGSPMAQTRSLLEKKLPSGWQFLLFDYSAVHDHWAARPEIAACLADYLADVSRTHQRAGGDGRVYVVAHSMGGLATLYAADPAYGGASAKGLRLAGLVTLDTPWTGSAWGNTPYSWLVQAGSNLRLPSVTSDAWTCLRRAHAGSATCSTPRLLGSTTAVNQIAGDITVRRMLFGLRAYDLPLVSDGIVSTDSQTGYLDSASGTKVGQRVDMRTVSCTEDLDSLGNVVLVGALPQMMADGHVLDLLNAEKVDASLLELFLRTQFTSACSHLKMPTNDSAIDQVVAALTAQAAARPLRPTDLLAVRVPADCEHPAGRLSNGRLPLSGDNSGFAMTWDATTKKFVATPLLTDLTGDGARELVGVMLCSAGGVTWPETVLVYTPSADGPQLLGSVNLGELTPHEHADVDSLKTVPGGVLVTWHSYEGCCFMRQDWTATLRTRDGTVALVNVAEKAPGRLSDTATIAADGVGPIRLGMTSAQLKAHLPDEITYNPAGGGFCASFEGQGLNLLLPEQQAGGYRLEYLTIDPGGWASVLKTAKGIALGSNVGEILSAYPRAVHSNTLGQGIVDNYSVQVGSNTLGFLITAGKVSRIVVATTGAWRSEELCA